MFIIRRMLVNFITTIVLYMFGLLIVKIATTRRILCPLITHLSQYFIYFGFSYTYETHGTSTFYYTDKNCSILKKIVPSYTNFYYTVKNCSILEKIVFYYNINFYERMSKFICLHRFMELFSHCGQVLTD